MADSGDQQPVMDEEDVTEVDVEQATGGEDSGSQETVVETDSVRRGTRHRVPTEKGLMHMLETKEKKLKYMCKQMDSRCEILQDLMCESVSVDELQREFTHWMKMYEDIMDIYDDCVCLMSSEAVESLSLWFSEKKRHIENIRVK